MPFRLLLYVLMCLALGLSACGGGGGGGDGNDDDDPLQLLVGSWKGPCMLGGGTLDMTIDPTGAVTQLDFNGVPENATGTFRPVTARLYAITLVFAGGQMSEWRLLIDGTATHAAFAEVDQFVQMAAMQKDATTVPPRTLADYAPDQYAGEAARFDAAAALLQQSACDMDIAANAEFDGLFGTISFNSPAGSPLDLRVANGTVLDGSYEDDAATSGANLFFLVSCPDGEAVSVLALDTSAGEMLFFGLLGR